VPILYYAVRAGKDFFRAHTSRYLEQLINEVRWQRKEFGGSKTAALIAKRSFCQKNGFSDSDATALTEKPLR
jgi:hypothetical protein